MTASLRFKKLDLQKCCKRKVVPTGTGWVAHLLSPANP